MKFTVHYGDRFLSSYVAPAATLARREAMHSTFDKLEAITHALEHLEAVWDYLVQADADQDLKDDMQIAIQKIQDFQDDLKADLEGLG